MSDDNNENYYLPYQKFGRKYLLPAFMVLLFVLMLGQLALELLSVKQLNKVSGTITGLQKEKIINDDNAKDTSRFSLAITLNNNARYTIENADYASKLNSELKPGEEVTIYYPTQLIDILSATFAESVSQVEAGGQVLYSFESQKQDNWYIIGFCVVGILFFYGFYRFLKGRNI